MPCGDLSFRGSSATAHHVFQRHHHSTNKACSRVPGHSADAKLRFVLPALNDLHAWMHQHTSLLHIKRRDEHPQCEHEIDLSPLKQRQRTSEGLTALPCADFHFQILSLHWYCKKSRTWATQQNFQMVRHYEEPSRNDKNLETFLWVAHVRESSRDMLHSRCWVEGAFFSSGQQAWFMMQEIV